MQTHPRSRLRTLLLPLLILTGCGADTGRPEPADTRWYTSLQVEQGHALFQTHCASCHGNQAEGTTEWRTLDPDGHYPPPPLNGTAHAWHHPRQVLEQTIAKGGIPLGGVMPAFEHLLSADDARTTIAYFQSYWSDEIYAGWQAIDTR